MIKGSTMLIAGITFSSGLLLGLLLHLPGAYSPSATSTRNDNAQRHKRSVRFTDLPYMDETSTNSKRGVLLENSTVLKLHKNVTFSQSDKGLNSGGPISKVGLLRTISSIKLPVELPPLTGSSLNIAVKSGGEAGDTVNVNIRGVNAEQVARRTDKHTSVESSTGDDNSLNSLAHNDNEIEIVLNNDASSTLERKNSAVAEEFEFNQRQIAGIVGNVVQDAVYWSPEVEDIVPKGFSDEDVKRWRAVVDDGKVVRVAEGCGRMQNRKLTLADGTMACARYRLNTDQMQGEVYSFYLAQVLNIRNVPPLLLQLADTRTDMWSTVDEDVITAQWHPGKVVALTPWLDDLEPAYIPESLRPSEGRKLHPDEEALSKLSNDKLIELAQWSDLIIFDYLTANMDRVVNNMFNLQWNAAMMESPAHNLEKSTKSSNLIFLDNESGLFHSYRLLGRYSNYHDELLQSLCIFRKQTADAVSRLFKSRDIAVQLQKTFEESEPLWRNLPRIPQTNIQTLQARIDSVHNQIQRCKAKFSTNR